jgi:multimeric flavodoxin WrbA
MAKVVAIIGSYRPGGITDQAVDAVLEGARTSGASTEKIYLIEQNIEFCRNCRMCCQVPGRERGECVHQDDLDSVLKRIEDATAIVLGSPVNYYNVTAIFRRFMERLIGYTYWPWGENFGPLMRKNARLRKAILVASAALPAIFIPVATGAPRALKLAAKMVGAKSVGKLWIGGAGTQSQERLRPRVRSKALKLGRRLV